MDSLSTLEFNIVEQNFLPNRLATEHWTHFHEALNYYSQLKLYLLLITIFGQTV